ncbi:MAG: ester cyclase [Actinobacteria bacterium]|nr:MAG: ester cyclase [Actinomycetota bacterium]
MSTSTETDLAATARGALQFVCSGQLERLPEFYDEQFVDHVNSMVFRGHPGARESVGFYRSLFGDLRFEIDDQVTEGDRVATRWTLHGTYRRRAVALHGIVISRLRDGRIVEDYGVTDSLELPRALGLARTLMLVVDVVRGRVKLPRGALRN